MDLKTKKKKKKKAMSKQILPVANRGSILSILLFLEVFGSLVDRAVGVAKVVNDNKAVQHQLEELKRHNRVAWKVTEYLAPYKCGRGV